MLTDNSLTVSDSYANVNVTGSVYVGGFVGYMGSGRFSNCASEGKVSATSQFMAHVGGFIGRLEGYNNVVSRCSAKCQVECAATGGNAFAGGFVGKTVGGTYGSVYSDCVYYKSVCNLDRIGNPSTGRGDGISAVK